MLKFYPVFALSLIFQLQSIAVLAAQAKSDILLSAENPKYHLMCVFHGEKVHQPGTFGELSDEVRYVTISDQQTGESATVKFLDLDSLKYNLSPAVWSPDMEWLLIPLGIHDGFRFVEAKNALKELQREPPGDFLRLAWNHDNGDNVRHTFRAWVGPRSFTFSAATLPEIPAYGFTFDLADRSLHPYPHRRPPVG